MNESHFQNGLYMRHYPCAAIAQDGASMGAPTIHVLWYRTWATLAASSPFAHSFGKCDLAYCTTSDLVSYILRSLQGTHEEMSWAEFVRTIGLPALRDAAQPSCGTIAQHAINPTMLHSFYAISSSRWLSAM